MKNNQHLPHEHPKVQKKTGILIINLGTPEKTDFWSVRKYLKEFLSDKRVIEVPFLVWQIILNLFILTFRPSKTAEIYKKVWYKKTNESPLRYYTRQQAKKLSKIWEKNKNNVVIDWAMRYGSPSIKNKMQELTSQGCQNIIILPLYPQYAASTTATVRDEVYRVLLKMRWQPNVRFVDPYHDHPLYIQALSDSVESHLKKQSWKTEKLIASFHGIPKAYFDKGDPYQCFCQKTGRLLKESLKMSDDNFLVTFQSRFGPKEWLQPYTDITIENLAHQGIKNLAVITPGFSSDCIETLEEIGIEAKKTFLDHGGKNFTLIPCLNDEDSHIQLMKNILESTAIDWLE